MLGGVGQTWSQAPQLFMSVVRSKHVSVQQLFPASQGWSSAQPSTQSPSTQTVPGGQSPLALQPSDGPPPLPLTVTPVSAEESVALLLIVAPPAPLLVTVPPSSYCCLSDVASPLAPQAAMGPAARAVIHNSARVCFMATSFPPSM